MASALIDFHRLQKPDSEGRSLETYWGWDHDTLEQTHDFIQWMFPLAEPSGVNSRAPLVTPEDQGVFRQDPRLQAAVRRSLSVFLDFLGLEMNAKGQVVAASHFDQRLSLWARPNHNWLRITRLLKSLRLLGFEPEARAVWTCLRELHTAGYVSENSFGYWSEAAEGLESD